MWNTNTCNNKINIKKGISMKTLQFYIVSNIVKKENMLYKTINILSIVKKSL